MNHQLYRIFTDGSCYHPPALIGDGIGGWCALVVKMENDKPEWCKMLWGAESVTSITQCELTPIVRALRYIVCKDEYYFDADVIVMSDSEYVIKRLSERKKAEPLMDRDFGIPGSMLWYSADRLSVMFHSVRYLWVPRNSNYYNEFCDDMAGSVYATMRNTLMTLFGDKYLDPSSKVDIDKPIPKAD